MSMNGATGKAWKLVAVVLAMVVLAIAASVAGALAPRQSVDQGQTRLEAAGAVGIDPFTPDLRLMQEQPVVPSAPRSNQEVDGRALRTTEAAPGACDAEELLKTLMTDPERRDAWRSVFSLADEDLPALIGGLTPASLSQDTVVMNHGYRDGRPQPVRTILQAGTLVLVDGFGLPRVLCKCGNPLLTSAPVGMEMPVGDPWPGFDSKQVVSLVAVERPTVTPSQTPIPLPTPLPGATPTATPLPTPTPTLTPVPTVTQTPDRPPPPPPPPTTPPTPSPPPTTTPAPTAEAPESLMMTCTVDPFLVAPETNFIITVNWTPSNTVMRISITNEIGSGAFIAGPWQGGGFFNAESIGTPLVATGTDALDRVLATADCDYDFDRIIEEQGCPDERQLANGECCPQGTIVTEVQECLVSDGEF